MLDLQSGRKATNKQGLLALLLSDSHIYRNPIRPSWHYFPWSVTAISYGREVHRRVLAGKSYGVEESPSEAVMTRKKKRRLAGDLNDDRAAMRKEIVEAKTLLDNLYSADADKLLKPKNELPTPEVQGGRPESNRKKF